MTDKIKSAIHCMRTSQDKEVCEECPIYGEVGTDHCFEESCRIAENSLKAWEKVLQELEENRKGLVNTEYDLGARKGIGFAIKIINQHLSDVPDTNVGEIEG